MIIYILLFCCVLYVGFAYLVIRLANKRNLEWKRWVFYAIYLNIFALAYLLLTSEKFRKAKGT
jgi:hypothetical protein